MNENFSEYNFFNTLLTVKISIVLLTLELINMYSNKKFSKTLNIRSEYGKEEEKDD